MDGKGLSGNKGEWSELYVFLRALGDGRIYAADGKLRKKPDAYLDINRVIRKDSHQNLDFIRIPEEDLVRILKNNEQFTDVEISELIEQYRYLLAEIRRGTKSFPIPKTETFVRSIGCTTIKAPSSDKTDITMEIHEPRTGMDLIQGFSIKSQLGSPSTLCNASEKTNFIFKLNGNIDEQTVEKVNSILESKTNNKVRKGLGILKSKEIELEFIDTDGEELFGNLTLIDSSMPELVGEMLKLYYINGISKLSDLASELKRRNPNQYRNNSAYPYYELKIKKMLVSFALGMQPGTKWNGYEETNGGYIVVKKDGDVVCYHIFDRMDFEDYLLNNTKLDTGSTGKHKFARIYLENGEYRIKLNLQIRFVDP